MKSITYFVVGLLLVSGFAAISIGEEAGEHQKTINLTFSGIKVIDSVDPYVEINFEGAGGRLYHPCQPVLPSYITTMDLPFGTQITDIECQIGEIQTMTLEHKIVPAPTPVTPSIEDTTDAEYIPDETIYNSNELFPDNWFDYYVGVGRDENKDHKTFLTIRAFPVRYSPGLDTVKYVEDLELTITYLVPEDDPFPSNSDYNLVIIAPEKFVSELDKLVTHKNKYGVKTLLKTTEDIYSEYSGVDKPEEIKYFIKDALETYDMDYVLLVGGLKSIIYGNPRDDKNQGTKDWFVPVRYTNLVDPGPTIDPGFISDLYYADIYKEGGVFDDWDSDDDGLFAKWDLSIWKDVIDFYPDVYVGRLPCRNTFEVRIMVNKIINYEKNAHGKSWYNKIILAGGDSFDDRGTNYLEGEVVCERVADDYMSEFTQVKLYASNKNTNPSKTPTGANIIREIKKGAGHLFLDGHASPFTWTTHWPGEFGTPESWTPRFWVFDFPKIFNFNKLPVCCVEGCHNNQFNVSLIYTMRDKDNSKKSWCYGYGIPECWSWWLTRKIAGGSLAAIGNTGLGVGAIGEHGDQDNDGILEPDILEAFGGLFFDQFYLVFDEGNDILGDCHSGALSNYLKARPGMGDQIDAKTMEQMALIGDPSLKIGGYPAGNGLRVEIIDAGAGVIGAPSEDVMFQASAYNGQETYTFTWDFDNDGVYDDAEGEIASWSWNLPGIYWVSVKVTDKNDDVDTYDTIVSIEFGASTPSKPDGETKLKAGVSYTYETSINTQGGYWNHIYYKFSWGDGTETDWIETPSASHSWNKKGIYGVKVKALLTHESTGGPDDTEDFKETDWSDPLLVSLSRSRSIPRSFIQLLQYFFGNYPNAFPLLRHLLGL